MSIDNINKLQIIVGVIMSDIISDSAKIRQSIRKIVKQVLEEETKPCFRLYKAQLKGLPNGKTCEVQIVGDANTINLPYSSSISSVAVNDMVWVATIYNSFSNAIVWQPIDFKQATGGGGGGTTVVANPTVDVSDAYLIGLQVGDNKYKVFSAKDTNGFVEKSELALYYHGVTVAFHRNNETEDPIYAQICYYSKTKDIYDFGSLMDDIVNYQQGKTFICNCICTYSSSEGEVTTFIKEIFYNEETSYYCLRLAFETEAVEITTTAEVYDYRIDVIEY